MALFGATSSKIKSKHVTLAAFAIVTIMAVLGFYLYGRGLGDPSCSCTSQDQAGWNAASSIITILFMMFVAVVIWRPDIVASV
jgi:hypothetical protein